MAKACVCAGILVVVLCFPTGATPQDFGNSYLRGAVDLGSLHVSPSVKLGYQKMAFSLSLPVPFSEQFGAELATASALDLKLVDGGVWMGGLDVDVRRHGFTAFCSIEASARKNARISTSSDPFWAGQYPVEWAGTGLQWWAIGGGGSMDIQDSLAILGGVKIEQWSVRLGGAVDTLGVIQQFEATYGDRYSGDFQIKLWMPYIGAQIRGPFFTGWFRVSPIVWGDVKIPMRYLYIGSPTFIGFEEASYAFKRNGLWLEGVVQSGVQISDTVSCNIWCKASWLQMRGSGSEDYRFDALDAGVPVHIWNNSGSATGHYQSSIIAGGIDGTLVF